ncbi:MAG: FAD-dependent oxidoreductase, partial [Flaviramulus sp.]|nr:FAD-dependent oxidoreductase [Flaviramulus sp.]
MEVDYLVIGIGIAGISFCEQLKDNNKSFVVFDNASQQSSRVAGGLYNPVVLKRFTSVWKSKEQLKIALTLYEKLEKQLRIKLDYKIPVYRKFASLEEQNNWFSASDKPLLSDYLSTTIIKNDNQSIDAPFGFGEVFETGRVDVSKMIEAYI